MGRDGEREKEERGRSARVRLIKAKRREGGAEGRRRAECGPPSRRRRRRRRRPSPARSSAVRRSLARPRPGSRFGAPTSHLHGVCGAHGVQLARTQAGHGARGSGCGRAMLSARCRAPGGPLPRVPSLRPKFPRSGPCPGRASASVFSCTGPVSSPPAAERSRACGRPKGRVGTEPRPARSPCGRRKLRCAAAHPPPPTLGFLLPSAPRAGAGSCPRPRPRLAGTP